VCLSHFADLEGVVGQSALSQVPAFSLLQDLDIIQAIQLLLCLSCQRV